MCRKKKRRKIENSKSRELKDYLYFDKESILSYNAQLYRGVQKSFTTESADEIVHHGSEKETKIQIGAEPQGVFFVTNIMNWLGLKTEFSRTSTKPQADHLETNRHISIYEHQEDMLDDLLYHLEPEALDEYEHEKQPLVGKLYTCRGEFSFVNFERISALMNDSFLPLYKDFSPQAFSAFESIKEYLPFLKSAIPFDSIMYCGPYLVPIVETNLRVDKTRVGFILGTQTTVVGRIVKRLSADSSETDAPIKNALNGIQYLSTKFLHELGFVKSQSPIYILVPVAIYI